MGDDSAHKLSRGPISVLLCCSLLLLTVPISRAADKNLTGHMQLTSTAFADGETIPEKYTCAGRNVSPPLKWSGIPPGTKSLVLIVDDPDAPAGDWIHWVVYDLPSSAQELPEDVSKGQYLPNGAKQGLNDFRHLGYGGPCPPAGKPHRYYFRLYALDISLGFKPAANKKTVEVEMANHILANGQLMGTYQKK